VLNEVSPHRGNLKCPFTFTVIGSLYRAPAYENALAEESKRKPQPPRRAKLTNGKILSDEHAARYHSQREKADGWEKAGTVTNAELNGDAFPWYRYTKGERRTNSIGWPTALQESTMAKVKISMVTRGKKSRAFQESELARHSADDGKAKKGIKNSSGGPESRRIGKSAVAYLQLGRGAFNPEREGGS